MFVDLVLPSKIIQSIIRHLPNYINVGSSCAGLATNRPTREDTTECRRMGKERGEDSLKPPQKTQGGEMPPLVPLSTTNQTDQPLHNTILFNTTLRHRGRRKPALRPRPPRVEPESEKRGIFKSELSNERKGTRERREIRESGVLVPTSSKPQLPSMRKIDRSRYLGSTTNSRLRRQSANGSVNTRCRWPSTIRRLTASNGRPPTRLHSLIFRLK